jgi:hypothetical protein
VNNVPGVSLPIVVFEVLGYACLGLCIWHALHQGPLRRARLIELGIGVLYGLTLETLTIMQLHVYQYGHFLIMLGPVPLSVAVGWGIIRPPWSPSSAFKRIRACSSLRAVSSPVEMR